MKFNQELISGLFPSYCKMASIVHIYLTADKKTFKKLLSIGKVFENLFLMKCSDFFLITNYYEPVRLNLMIPASVNYYQLLTRFINL